MKAGLQLDEFWGDDMTPAVFLVYAKAYRERLWDGLVNMDRANHMLGQYIRAAVADVIGGRSSYPRQPFTEKVEATEEKPAIRKLTPEETEAFLASLED